jgi:transposase
MNKEDFEKAVSENLSRAELAQKFQVSRGTVTNYLKKWGLKVKGSRPEVDENAFREAVAKSYTIASVIKKMEWAMAGSSYARVRRLVSEYGISTEHFDPGKARGKGGYRLAWSDILIENSPYRLTKNRKDRLISQGLLSAEVCALCGCPPIWQNKPLVLRLDHINGVNNDHRLTNLRLICPNCDSQLPTYCGRNKSRG